MSDEDDFDDDDDALIPLDEITGLPSLTVEDKIGAIRQTISDREDARPKVCGANLASRPGETCQRKPVKGRTRCRKHGGTSLAGFESGVATTCRQSKFLPQRLVATYLEALRDPDLLSLREDVALIEVRKAENLSHLNVSALTWQMLKDDLASLETALNTDDQDTATYSLKALKTHLQEGSVDAARWRDVVDDMKTKRMMVDTERKYIYEESNAIQLEQLVALQKATLMIIGRYVTDEDVKFQIVDEFRRMFG